AVEVNRILPQSAHPIAMQPHTFDHEPSVVRLPDGAIQAVWSAYHGGREWIRGRVVRDAREEVFERVSPGGGVQGMPEVLAAKDGSVWAFWAAVSDGRWSVMARMKSAGLWREPLRLSPADTDSLHPAAEEGP